MQAADSTHASWRAACAALRANRPQELAGWLRAHLFDHVLPFWEAHGRIGAGGIATCVHDDGRIASDDRWLWSQWRAVWVYSRIYNRLQPQPRWREHARAIATFCCRHGWLDEVPGWALVVGDDGTVRKAHESTYVDAFAIYGLVELYRATRESRWLEIARTTGAAALRQLAGPYDAVPHFPYPIPPGAKPHGIPMLWSLTFAELAMEDPSGPWAQASARLSAEIWADFYRPARGLLLEFVRGDGMPYPPPMGTSVVPGHVIEDMWFQRHATELRRAAGWLEVSPRSPEELWAVAARHLAVGWDEARAGGLLLAVDADGAAEVGWRFAETKLWWPHTEALYTSLLGWCDTGRPECLEWYERVWRVCLQHFVDWEHGEWRQKLARDFTPITDVVALPVKDPFHLPRSLILQIELLERGLTAITAPHRPRSS